MGLLDTARLVDGRDEDAVVGRAPLGVAPPVPVPLLADAQDDGPVGQALGYQVPQNGTLFEKWSETENLLFFEK